MQTIHISDTVYQRLQEQAAQLQMTTEQVIEQLLTGTTTPISDSDELNADIPTAGSAEALAAVERLASLFARLPLTDIDAVLNDPALALAHADFDHSPR